MTLVADAGASGGTGEALCAYGYGLLDKTSYEESRGRTDVMLAWIADPVLRDALAKFAEVIPPMTSLHPCPFAATTPAGRNWYADMDLLARRPLTIWVEGLLIQRELEHKGSRLPRAVQAIAEIQNELGLSLRLVLKAARVRPRTYHSWRENPDRRPRLSSQGRLWRLHQLAEDLVEALGDVGAQRWLAEDDARVAALLRGQFDDVAAAAYSGLGRNQDSVRDFDGALDERESSPRIPRYPVTGVKMSPYDVAGPHS